MSTPMDENLIISHQIDLFRVIVLELIEYAKADLPRFMAHCYKTGTLPQVQTEEAVARDLDAAGNNVDLMVSIVKAELEYESMADSVIDRIGHLMGGLIVVTPTQNGKTKPETPQTQKDAD